MNRLCTSRRVPCRHALLVLLLAGLAAACPKRMPGPSMAPVAPPAARPHESAAKEEKRAPPAPGAAAEQPPLEKKPAVDAESRKKVDEALTRAGQLLAMLDGRTLTDSQREERDAGATFMSQARDALESGDPERALVLAKKALVLVENLERETR